MDNAHFDIEPLENEPETPSKSRHFDNIPFIFSEPMKSQKKTTVRSSGFKSLGTIVKIIAFFVALAVIGIHTFAAYLLFAFRPLYASICIAIVTLGLVLALIILFLIYALGHSINQNNEIIALLKKHKK